MALNQLQYNTNSHAVRVGYVLHRALVIIGFAIRPDLPKTQSLIHTIKNGPTVCVSEIIMKDC